MARTSTHLNFAGKAEQAFSFYRSVFGVSLQVWFDTPNNLQNNLRLMASRILKKSHLLH